MIPTAGKIYEKRLCDQISNHTDPILSPNITAYRKNHSCDTTLLRLVGEWKKKLDCGKVDAHRDPVLVPVCGSFIKMISTTI